MAARHCGYLLVTQDGSSLRHVLRPCHTQAHSLTLATGFLAASAILVLATIVDDWPIDQGYNPRDAQSAGLSLPDTCLQ